MARQGRQRDELRTVHNLGNSSTGWGRINASTDLPLKHTCNKLYKKLVLQHLVLLLFDNSRKGSTRFVSTGIRSTKIWIYRIKFYKNRFYRK